MYEVQEKQAGFKMQQTTDKQQIDFKSKQNRGHIECLKSCPRNCSSNTQEIIVF